MTRKTVLTGVTGQDGSHLTDFIKKGYKIIVKIRSSSLYQKLIIFIMIFHNKFIPFIGLNWLIIFQHYSMTKPDEIYNLGLNLTSILVLKLIFCHVDALNIKNFRSYSNIKTSKKLSIIKRQRLKFEILLFRKWKNSFRPRSLYAISKWAYWTTVNIYL